MPEPVKDIKDPPRHPEMPADWPVKCQLCGTLRQTKDSILCRVCGEPVLNWGWAP